MSVVQGGDSTAQPDQLELLAEANVDLRARLNQATRELMATLEATHKIESRLPAAMVGVNRSPITEATDFGGQLPSENARKLRQVNSEINALHSKNSVMHAQPDSVHLASRLSQAQEQLATITQKIARTVAENNELSSAIHMMDIKIEKKEKANFAGRGMENGAVDAFKRDFEQAAHEADVCARQLREAERQCQQQSELSRKQDEKIATLERFNQQSPFISDHSSTK